MTSITKVAKKAMTCNLKETKTTTASQKLPTIMTKGQNLPTKTMSK